MPALPTLNVTTEQANRMLAAWGSQAAYLAWLKEQIIEYVIDAESQATWDDFHAQRRTAEDRTRQDLS